MAVTTLDDLEIALFGRRAGFFSLDPDPAAIGSVLAPGVGTSGDDTLVGRDNMDVD